MSEVILVVLERQRTAANLLAATARLAELIGGARINVLGRTEALPPEEQTALRQAFDSWAGAQPENIRAQWLKIEGRLEASIEEKGRRADFIVIAQPEQDKAARHTFRVALFQTDRPVLMMPTRVDADFGRCMAIAWRDDQLAVKAVIPALRFLTRAATVHVLVGTHAGAQPPALPRVLIEHGVPAELQVIPIASGVFGKDLLGKAHELGADMLVMGAHLHSRLLELMLGGLTRYIIDHADIPVLMRH
jgi:nucleotide-binding universal stress UspA family protein